MQNPISAYWAVEFLNFRVDFFALLFIIALSVFVEDGDQVRDDTTK